MTKEAFIDSVETLYDMRDRVAKNAKYMIEDMLREKGDMDREYLYGDTEDPDWVWVGESDEHLTDITTNEEGDVIVWIEDFYDQCRSSLLKNLPPDDIIEIADILCRM